MLLAASNAVAGCFSCLKAPPSLCSYVCVCAIASHHTRTSEIKPSTPSTLLLSSRRAHRLYVQQQLLWQFGVQWRGHPSPSRCVEEISPRIVFTSLRAEETPVTHRFSARLNPNRCGKTVFMMWLSVRLIVLKESVFQLFANFLAGATTPSSTPTPMSRIAAAARGFLSYLNGEWCRVTVCSVQKKQ